MNKAKESANLISDNDIVTSYQCGDYTEIICSKHKASSIDIKRLNKTQYVDKHTGCIREYQFSGNKTFKNFKKEFKNIPRYIKGYFCGDESERLITLTYSSNMNNPYQLSTDFKNFILKLERRCGKCRYLYIKEPQDNGSWHIHAIVKSMESLKFPISDEKISLLWKLGDFVNVQQIYNIDTLPYYFDITRYADKKRRIRYYPAYLHIFGHSEDMKLETSRGIYETLIPESSDMIYEAEKRNDSYDTETGAITGYFTNIYQQFLKRKDDKNE